VQLNPLVPARVRHLTRYREIATILARHGLGWLVVQLGLSDLVPFQRGWFGHPRRETPYTQAEHFRMAFEDLGVTFTEVTSGHQVWTNPEHARRSAPRRVYRRILKTARRRAACAV